MTTFNVRCRLQSRFPTEKAAKGVLISCLNLNRELLLSNGASGAKLWNFFIRERLNKKDRESLALLLNQLIEGLQAEDGSEVEPLNEHLVRNQDELSSDFRKVWNLFQRKELK